MTQDNPTPPPSGQPIGSTPPPAGTTPVDYAAPASGPAAYMGPPPTQDDKTMGMLCHLLAIFTWFIGPLIIWLMKKDTSPFVDDQGKEALNFQLTMLIVNVIGAITSCFVIGFFIMLAALVINLVFCILATLQAKDGVAYRYPLTIRIIK